MHQTAPDLRGGYFLQGQVLLFQIGLRYHQIRLNTHKFLHLIQNNVPKTEK